MKLLKDLRHAWRQLRKNPGFALTAVLSLALGIAATTSVFSVVYGLVMHPYPYRSADRMINILIEDKGGNRERVLLTGSQFQQLRQAAPVESAVAWQSWDLPMTGADLPEDVRATFLTSNASAYFGVPLLFGHGLGGARPVAVLSYSFWSRHYNLSPAVLGKTLQLLRKNYTIVGVMPHQFSWTGADVYLPLQISYDPHSVLSFSVTLKPGVRMQAAGAELQALFKQFARQNPTRFPAAFRIRIEPLTERYGQNLRHTLYVLFGAVALLLLIGCANTSILLLARGASRRHELGIRVAIGASRARIVRQLLTESLALSLSGAFLGVLLAYGAVPLIMKWLPQSLYPREAAIAINLPVLAFCAVLAFLTPLLFGLLPALRLST